MRGIFSLPIQKGNDFVQTPDVIGNPGFHRRGYTEGLMDAPKIVVHVAERQHAKSVPIREIRGLIRSDYEHSKKDLGPHRP